MSKFSIMKDLVDRKIEGEGEEFYAVLSGYVKKINSLAELETKDAKALLRAAAKFEVTGSDTDKKALDAEVKAFLAGQDETVVKICTSKASNAEKIEALNDYAILLGAQRQMSENIFRSRQYANMNDILLAESDNYDANKAYYATLSKLVYNDAALEAFIKKSAGNVATPMEALKTAVKQNLMTEEDNFLNQQTRYVSNAVSLIVEDCSRILMHSNDAPADAAQAS